MGRFFGGKIGLVQDAGVYLASLKGVFSISDQYYSKRRSGWKLQFAAGGDNTYQFVDTQGDTWTILEFTQPGTLVCNEPGVCDVFINGS